MDGSGEGFWGRRRVVAAFFMSQVRRQRRCPTAEPTSFPSQALFQFLSKPITFFMLTFFPCKPSLEVPFVSGKRAPLDGRCKETGKVSGDACWETDLKRKTVVRICQRQCSLHFSLFLPSSRFGVFYLMLFFPVKSAGFNCQN